MEWRNFEHYLDPTAAIALANVAKTEKPLVFICSPFAGNVAVNVDKAKRYMRLAIQRGTIPFAPHLLYPQVLNDGVESERELGLAFGLAMLCRCDELWVFGEHISPGMEGEIALAKKRKMPIRHFNLEEVK